jgi:hypothetical protein
MNWVTYQGTVVGGRVALPASVKLPEKATVLVTVLAEGIPATPDAGVERDEYVRSQQALLDDVRALREDLRVEGVLTDSVAALDQAREERLGGLMDLH